MTGDLASYAVLTEGDPPPGAQVHAIAHRSGRSAPYRTIRVMRRDGTIWYCRAVLVDPSKPAGGIAELPDGRHFYAGGHIVDRDDPSSMRWLMMAANIVWSNARDLAFILGNDVIAAFGIHGKLWQIQLPGADPDDFIGVDFIHEDTLRCVARQWQRAADGEPVYVNYEINAADGSIRKQWADELLPEETN